MFKIIVYTASILFGFGLCINLCGDWTQYKDIKCINIFDQTVTETEAFTKCTEVDPGSILLTILNREEQTFIEGVLKNNSISNDFWIGLKNVDNGYQWVDEGLPLLYDNWAVNTDKMNPCVKMATSGRWKDITCNSLANIICQKRQDFNLGVVRYLLENMEKDQLTQMKHIESLQKDKEIQKGHIETLQKNFKDVTENNEKQQKLIEGLQNDKNSLSNELKDHQVQIGTLIPINFLYTQLPNQSAPQVLWPKMFWTEVTQQYVGLFFRAEGINQSEPFGQVQKDNQKEIIGLWVQGSAYKHDSRYSRTFNISNAKDYSVKEKTFGPNVKYVEIGKRDPYWKTVERLGFWFSQGDVRPRNTAIKIWKRTG